MALLRLIPTLVLATVVSLLVLAFVACGGSGVTADATPTPTSPAPPGTITPTPDADSETGFIAALRQLDKELNGGRVDPLISRFAVREYTCTAADIAGGPGAVSDCRTAGEKIRVVRSSAWRSEGGFRTVEALVANLNGYQANFDPARTDGYGAGTFRVYAYDPTTKSAVITVTSKCLPQTQCPPAGFQRLVWVLDFDYLDARWKIDSIMYAFVLGEEFLDPPSPEAKQRLPRWTKFQ